MSVFLSLQFSSVLILMRQFLVLIMTCFLVGKTYVRLEKIFICIKISQEQEILTTENVDHILICGTFNCMGSQKPKRCYCVITCKEVFLQMSNFC